jgi:hypothetical protein
LEDLHSKKSRALQMESKNQDDILAAVNRIKHPEKATKNWAEPMVAQEKHAREKKRYKEPLPAAARGVKTVRKAGSNQSVLGGSLRPKSPLKTSSIMTASTASILPKSPLKVQK